MFRQHGWTTPATWDELFELCEKIKKAGVAPMTFQGRYPYYAQSLYDHVYYHINGPKMYFDKQYLVPGTFDNPGGVEAIRLVRKLGARLFPDRGDGDEPYGIAAPVFPGERSDDPVRVLAQERDEGEDSRGV
jgi:ABC-type glycerol-3-phosphate transport system substrate-binding protein